MKLSLNNFNSHILKGWYSTGSYFLAKTLVDLPFNIVVYICYALLLYKMTNQINDNNQMLSYIALTIMAWVCGHGLAFAVGAIVSNAQLGMLIFIGFISNSILLSRFFAPPNELPAQWLPHLFFVNQVYENNLILIYGFNRCPDGQTQTTLFQMYLNGDTERTFWINCLLLVFYIIFYRVITLFVLIIKSNSLTSYVIHRIITKKNKRQCKLSNAEAIELAQIAC